MKLFVLMIIYFRKRVETRVLGLAFFLSAEQGPDETTEGIRVLWKMLG